MRWYSFLLPLLIAAILSWTPGSAAHPCHEHSAITQADNGSESPAASVNLASGAEMPGKCPGGYRGCTTECMAQCATAIAVPGTSGIGFFAGREVFEPTRIAALSGWPPSTEADPPRPFA